MPPPPTEESDLERFHESYTIVDDCWVWHKSKNWKGYGQFSSKGKTCSAHRVSLILHKIPIPEGHVVRHKCPKHLRHCVNPAHLTTGTYAENTNDMIEDGTKGIGEKNPTAKLTEAQVLEIRASEMRQCELARKFNLTRGGIWRIITRKNWNHI